MMNDARSNNRLVVEAMGSWFYASALIALAFFFPPLVLPLLFSALGPLFLTGGPRLMAAARERLAALFAARLSPRSPPHA